MTCAKKRVIAKLTTTDGKVYYGENSCNNPQETCPRVEELWDHPTLGIIQYKYKHEDYTLCEMICKQSKHAEEWAIFSALKGESLLKGAKLEINHHRVCRFCLDNLELYQITDITLNAEIER